MSKAVDFWSFIREDLDDLAGHLRPIKAYVGTEDAEGRVTLRFPGQDTPTDQKYPKLAGPPLESGDPVYVLRRGDHHLVLGKISDGAWSGGDGEYAPIDHDHDGVYAPVSHHHDDRYSQLGHGHSPAEITMFAEYVRDVIGAALVAGTNITIDVDDEADTITIHASGGGSPSFQDLFPINEQVRPDQGNYNVRMAPSTSGTQLGSAAPNSDVHDTGVRVTADGFTWAYCWFPRLNWGWVIVDAFG